MITEGVGLNRSEKVAAFRQLTCGADDVFASFVLTGYEEPGRWKPVYGTLTDRLVRLHMTGGMEIGSYPLIPDGKWPMVRWVLADFDGKRPGTDWKRDVQNAVEFLMEHDGMPCFVNLSRSGNGAHIRMLFKDPVPAYLARRWMDAWLEEAGVMPDEGWEIPPSFDRLIPPQDSLSGETNNDGYRLPGNLAGSPLHGGHARRNGGTLPLSTEQVALGNFEPDGRHWEHVRLALESRAWGTEELVRAIDDCPGDVSADEPSFHHGSRSLPVVVGDSGSLSCALMFCKFLNDMHDPTKQSYALWVALATQLHRFGDDGYEAFHQISSTHRGYSPSDTDTKWEQTRMLHPVRCESLVGQGYHCEHLGDTDRCAGAKHPTYFADFAYMEVL